MLHQSYTFHFDTVAFSLSPNGSILFDVRVFRTIIRSLITEKPERDSKVKISVLKNAIKYILYTEHKIRDKLSALDGFGYVSFADVLLIAEGGRGRIPRTGLSLE